MHVAWASCLGSFSNLKMLAHTAALQTIDIFGIGMKIGTTSMSYALHWYWKADLLLGKQYMYYSLGQENIWSICCHFKLHGLVSTEKKVNEILILKPEPLRISTMGMLLSVNIIW